MKRLAHLAVVLTAAGALLAACSRPSDLPDGNVSRTKVDFQAPAAGGNPPAETLYVSNGGRGTLDAPTVAVSYQDGADWLTVTLTSSGDQYAIAVQPITTGLAAGSYRATLTLTWASGNAAPTLVSVTLVVPARTGDLGYQPSVEAVAIDAPRGGGDPAPASFQIVNAGRGTLPVPSIDVAYAGTATGWLTTAVAAASDGYTVTAQARAAGIPSGVHHATLTLRAAGGVVPARTLPVTLTVPPPEVVLSSHDVALVAPSGGFDAVAVVSAMNGGGGQLGVPYGTVTYDGGAWDGMLAVSVTGTQAPFTVALMARQSAWTPSGWTKLPPGTYTATVQLAAAGAALSDSVRVTLRVPAPGIRLDATEVAFSGFTACPLPSPATVLVFNGGAGTLAAPIPTVDAAAKDWLSATVGPIQTLVATAEDGYSLTLRLTAYPPLDSAGRASATVLLVDPAGVASPVALGVRFEALSPGLSTASVTPSRVDIWAQAGMGDPPARVISVRTPAACSAPFVVETELDASGPAWLSAVPAAASANQHDVAVVTSVAALGAGEQRSAIVHLRIPEKTWDVPVTLTAGTLSPAGPLQAASTNPLLTPLADGRALLTGTGAGAQVFDPTTRTWTKMGSPVKERYDHGVVELDDGRVLMCGGMAAAVDPQSGGTTYTWTSSCEVLTASGWAPTTWSLTSRRTGVSLLKMPRGRVLVVGWTYEGTSTPEVLDLATGRSTTLSGISATSAVKRTDGSILVAGENGKTWLYTPGLDAWSSGGDMAFVQQFGGLIALPGGRVLSLGGNDRWSGPELRTQIWDPATRTWSPSAAAPTHHWAGEVTQLASGKVLAVSSSSYEVFDPERETWSLVGTYGSVERAFPAVSSLSSGMVLFAGGRVREAGQWVTTVETFTW